MMTMGFYRLVELGT